MRAGVHRGTHGFSDREVFAVEGAEHLPRDSGEPRPGVDQQAVGRVPEGFPHDAPGAVRTSAAGDGLEKIVQLLAVPELSLLARGFFRFRDQVSNRGCFFRSRLALLACAGFRQGHHVVPGSRFRQELLVELCSAGVQVVVS